MLLLLACLGAFGWLVFCLFIRLFCHPTWKFYNLSIATVYVRTEGSAAPSDPFTRFWPCYQGNSEGTEVPSSCHLLSSPSCHASPCGGQVSCRPGRRWRVLPEPALQGELTAAVLLCSLPLLCALCPLHRNLCIPIQLSEFHWTLRNFSVTPYYCSCLKLGCESHRKLRKGGRKKKPRTETAIAFMSLFNS